MKIVLHMLFFRNFFRFWPILMLFLTIQRKMLARAKMIANSRLIYIFRKYMPEAISKPNLVALPLTSQELGRVGGFFAFPIQNRTHHIAQPNHYRVKVHSRKLPVLLS